MIEPRHHNRTIWPVLLAGLLACAGTASAQVSTDFLLFPQIDLLSRGDVGPTPYSGEGHHGSGRSEEMEAGIDLFLTLERGHFRFLGEFLLSTEEQDMERFQLGYSFGRHLLWLGRFHNPVGYWNTRYHHGAYIQTSISRPAIVAYEEHGGILPTHQAGLLLEGSLFERRLGYRAALATGPDFDGELGAWEVFEPGEGDRDASLTLDLFRESARGEYGAVLSHTTIPSHLDGLDEIRQWIAGSYLDFSWTAWQWHAAAYFVSNRLVQTSGTVEDGFLSAYLQGEFQASERLRLFARAEGTGSAGDDAYLALYPDFVERRWMGGLRFDFLPQNALKLELSQNRNRRGDFGQLMLQWSAQF